MGASAETLEEVETDMSWVAEWAARAAVVESAELESGEEKEEGSKGVAAASAAVGLATAGLAAVEAAEAVAMQEATEYYRHRCLDVGLGQLQWWLEGEAAEWAEGGARHMQAGPIWQCSRQARLGAEGRVWQQWSTVTAVWKAAAARAAAVNTVGTTEPTVGAVGATAAAATQAGSTKMREISHNTTLGGTAVQATNGGA